MNETDFLLQTYNCDKALQKASTHCTLMKIIQQKNNLIQIASNLQWNITALKAELSHLLLSVLFVVDINKTGKP